MTTLTTTQTAPAERRVITATEAAQELGIPTGTIRGWASSGKLYAVSIGPDRQRWYLLAEVLQLAAQRRARTRHERPSRRRLTLCGGDIA